MNAEDRVRAGYDSVAERICAEFCEHCGGMEQYPNCVRPPDGEWDGYGERCDLCFLAEMIDTRLALLVGDGTGPWPEGALGLLRRVLVAYHAAPGAEHRMPLHACNMARCKETWAFLRHAEDRLEEIGR